jgi:HK97 family phage major capsid protein
MAMLAPKTLMATTAYSRQLLATASFDVEGMVLDELAAIHALAIDFAAIHGLGNGGEPLGVYKALNVFATAVGGAMSYAKILAMVGQVATANADRGALGWLINPTMMANLKGVLTFPGANTGTAIWQGDTQNGTVAGFRALSSAQISKVMTGSERTGGSEIGTIFGNWQDLIIGSWGALELVVDPYSKKKEGLIEVTSFQLCDTLARHGESFSKSTGATG